MNESVPSSGGENELPLETFESFRVSETVPNSLTETFAVIQSITDNELRPLTQEVETTLGEFSDTLEKTEAETIQDAAFLERASFLEEKQTALKERFLQNVRTVLLPVVTALSFSGGPANADVVDLNQKTNWQNYSVPVSETVPTAGIETIRTAPTLEFAKNSVLETGAKKSERSKEELAHLYDLSRLTLEAKNEWAAISGIGKNGDFVASYTEAGPLGGRIDIEEQLSVIEKNVAFRHTHPVSAYGIKNKPFIMPPSTVDIIQCMDTVKFDVYEVIDPRGVWSYSCDKEHPFVKAKEGLQAEAILSLKNLIEKYHITPEDKETIDLNKEHPSTHHIRLFEALNTKYPGIKDESEKVLSSLGQKNLHLLNSLGQYEVKGGTVFNYSVDAKNADVDIAEKIRVVVEEAKKMGVTLSYQPYTAK